MKSTTHYPLKPLELPAALIEACKRRSAGVAFTLLIAAAGYGVALLPGVRYAGQMACAILLAILYRHYFGYPEALRTGIQFSGKHLLRLAIVLYGLKLNVVAVYRDGLGLLARDALVVAFGIGCTLLLAKWLRADMRLSLLLGIGTGICGAAAIAAVSPILRAKQEDTAVGAGLIALVGTVFAVGYTLLRPLLGLTDAQYGAWAGSSLHEIAHAALAAAPAGQDALAIALLAKLGRVFLLVPVCLVLSVVVRRMANYRTRTELLGQALAQPTGHVTGQPTGHEIGQPTGHKTGHETGLATSQPTGQTKQAVGQTSDKTPIPFPWFLLGFIAMSLLGSSEAGQHVMQAMPGLADGVTFLTTFLLTMAMVALGLNVDLRRLGGSTLRALAAMTISSVLLAAWTFFTL